MKGSERRQGRENHDQNILSEKNVFLIFKKGHEFGVGVGWTGKKLKEALRNEYHQNTL